MRTGIRRHASVLSVATHQLEARLKFRAWIAALVALPFTSSCSLMFVDGPKPVDQRGRYAATACTTSNAWPVVDTVFTGYFLLNVALAGSMSDEDLKKQNVSRGTAIGVNAGLVALALTSAIVGYSRVSECHEEMGGPAGYSAPR